MATDNFTPMNVKTKSAGDVSININQATPGLSNGVQVNAALPAGSNIIGKFGVDQTTPGVTNGVQVNAPLPTGGNSIGNVGLNAGTNLVGKFGIDQTTPGITNGVQVNAALPTGTNSIGSVAQSGPWSVTNLAGTNSIGGVTQSGPWSVTNLASANLIGKVGIDQTTPGVTNGVQITGPGTSTGNTLYNQVMGVYNTSNPVLTNGQTSIAQMDVSGNIKVVIGGGTGSTIGNVGINAGTNLIGGVRIDQTTPGVTNGFQLSGGPGTSSATPIFVNTGAGNSGTVKNSGQVISTSTIAAGSSATLVAPKITTAKVASLEHVVMSSSTPMRFDVGYIPNGGGTAVTMYTYFTTAARLFVEFDAMPGGEFTLPAADGTNALFQVIATSTDTNASPVSAYATLVWIEN